MKYCRTLVAQGLLADPATKLEMTRQRCWEDPPQRIGEPDLCVWHAAIRLIDTLVGSHKGHYVNPHTWTIGGTFESTFILPKPANAGNTRPRKRRAAKPGRKARAGSASRKSTTKPTRPQLTEEEKRELSRVHARENRERRKKLGLCKDCPNKVNQGQIRCTDCAQKHNKARQAQRE